MFIFVDQGREVASYCKVDWMLALDVNETTPFFYSAANSSHFAFGANRAWGCSHRDLDAAIDQIDRTRTDKLGSCCR